MEANTKKPKALCDLLSISSPPPLNSLIQFHDISSSILMFGSSSRETLISKCVLNTEMKNSCLNSEKNISVAAGLAISLVPLKKFPTDLSARKNRGKTFALCK